MPDTQDGWYDLSVFRSITTILRWTRTETEDISRSGWTTDTYLSGYRQADYADRIQQDGYIQDRLCLTLRLCSSQSHTSTHQRICPDGPLSIDLEHHIPHDQTKISCNRDFFLYYGTCSYFITISLSYEKHNTLCLYNTSNDHTDMMYVTTKTDTITRRRIIDTKQHSNIPSRWRTNTSTAESRRWRTACLWCLYSTLSAMVTSEIRQHTPSRSATPRYHSSITPHLQYNWPDDQYGSGKV